MSGLELYVELFTANDVGVCGRVFKSHDVWLADHQAFAVLEQVHEVESVLVDDRCLLTFQRREFGGRRVGERGQRFILFENKRRVGSGGGRDFEKGC